MLSFQRCGKGQDDQRMIGAERVAGTTLRTPQRADGIRVSATGLSRMENFKDDAVGRPSPATDDSGRPESSLDVEVKGEPALSQSRSRRFLG
jgi:hypothetical protein